MKRQYKAGYLDKNVFDAILQLRRKNELKFKIMGLLESISTFDTISLIKLENPESIPPLLAVVNNLIIRGTPTICSTYISEKLNSLLKEFTPQDFISALHIVDTRESIPAFYTYDLESNFERAFQDSYIPSDKKYLLQFFLTVLQDLQ